ncbi:MAG: hypothetical protein GY804_05820 [Alphaproteobacteria bacterium]|nr:hypothetical protein [Alphaproteobacteria bacterium]
MNILRLLPFTLLTLAALIQVKPSYAFECEHIPPEINVVIDTGKVVYDFSKSRKYISEIFNKDRGKSGLSHHTAGLTAAIFKSQITGVVKLTPASRSIKKRLSGGSKDNICVQLESVDIYLGYGDIVVYVDSQYQRGSCMFDAILRHENTHVNIYQTFLAHYSKYLKQTAEYLSKNQKPVWVSSKDEAKLVRNKMVEGILHGMQPSIQHYAKARDDENRNLDSNDNYAYTQSQCEAW